MDTIEVGQIWITKGKRTTCLRILKVWERSVTVTNLQGQNQRGLGIQDLRARYRLAS